MSYNPFDAKGFFFNHDVFYVDSLKKKKCSR